MPSPRQPSCVSRPRQWYRSCGRAAGGKLLGMVRTISGSVTSTSCPLSRSERPTSTRAIFCQPASTVNKGPTGANTTIATPRPRPRSFRGLLVRRGCQQHRNTTRRRWRTLTRCGAPRGLLPTAHASACLSGALPGLGGANGTRNGWVGCAKATPQARRTGTRNVTARGGAAAGSVAPTLAFGAPSISSRCPLWARRERRNRPLRGCHAIFHHSAILSARACACTCVLFVCFFCCRLPIQLGRARRPANPHATTIHKHLRCRSSPSPPPLVRIDRPTGSGLLNGLVLLLRALAACTSPARPELYRKEPKTRSWC